MGRFRKERRGDAIDVVIAGCGVGALEAALALNELAGDRTRLTIVAPTDDFVYQPVGTLQPFIRQPPRRLPLAEIAAEVNATVEQDRLVSVDASANRLVTGSGRQFAYDALVVAIGATAHTPLKDAVLLQPAGLNEQLTAVIQEIEDGSIQSLAFVAPNPAWPLPIYELALLARERAERSGNQLELTIVTAEGQPLEVFGQAVSNATVDLLVRANIKVITGFIAGSSADQLVVHPGASKLSVDRIVAVPRLEGPRIDGLPCDSNGFLPITANCAVMGVDDVYAAGDATNFPVKFGAITAQQAVAAAQSIAAVAGASLSPAPFDGTVHGVLLRGVRDQMYFSARIENGSAQDSHVSDQPILPNQAKVAAHYLGAYLDDQWASPARWVAGQLAWEGAMTMLHREEDITN